MAKKQKDTTARSAALDIRSVIGGLIGVYGVILVLMGLFGTTDAELETDGGINLNLWTGIGLVVFGALMGLWVVLKPIRPEQAAEALEDDTGAADGH